MKGRKPSPKYLRLVQGNPGKRATPKDIPEPEVEALPAPDWLTPAAAQTWAEIMPQLVRWGLFTALDVYALGILCESVAQYRAAKDALDAEGNLTYETAGRYGSMKRARPEVGIMNEAAKIVQRFGSEFGLSPAARVRLVGTAQGDLFPGGKAPSEWDAL